MPSDRQKKIAIIGAGIFSIPLIQKAKELGHYVIATHHKENNPGFPVCDKQYICDANNLTDLLKICTDEKIDGIATISEYAALPVAYVAKKLKLPGYDYSSAEILSNKFLLRQIQTKLNIPQPGYGFAKNEKEAKIIFESLSKPVMVKPINSCGSRGVFKAYKWEDVSVNLKKSELENFKESGLIIEEYMEGIELGGGVLIKNSKVFVFGITQKLVNDFFIPYANILPSQLDPHSKEKIIEYLNSIASELKIGDTYLNVNMILTKEGPRILELGGRLSGNSSPEITKLVYSVDPYEYVLNYSLGIRQDFSIREQKYFYSACIIGSKKSGKIKKINTFGSLFPEKKECLVKSFFNCQIGDQVSKMESTEALLGFFILKENSLQQIKELVHQVDQSNWIETE